MPVSIFVLLWIGSPALLYWLSRPPARTGNERLLRENHHMLRGYARQTWRFFDDLVGPDTNWLPPDNTQLALHVEVANRTSPTNIGLWLCSALAARDFGYLTADDALARCSNTMDTLERLQRYEGHLLNWYNTTTAEPLFPRYVSTVDSGNLLASLWLFAQGCDDIVRNSFLGHGCMRGLSDTLAQIERLGRGDPSLAVPLQTLRKLLRGRGDVHQLIGRLRMATLPAGQLLAACRQLSESDERCYWSTRLAAEIAAWNRMMDVYLKWVETLTRLPDSLLHELGSDVVRLRRRALHARGRCRRWPPADRPLCSRFWRGAIRRGSIHGSPPGCEELDNEHRQAQSNAALAAAELAGFAATGRWLFANGINMRFPLRSQAEALRDRVHGGRSGGIPEPLRSARQ